VIMAPSMTKARGEGRSLGGMPRVARTALWAGAAVAIGVLNTLSLMGFSGVDPRNIAWLRGDAATYYIAWAAYRAETTWRWPLTWTDRLGYPLGVSMSWFDPVPIMAVLLRPLSPLLPAPFQYLGLYTTIAFILQAWFSLRLAACLFAGRALFTLATALLVVGAPIVTMRVISHYAVGSHWLMIACLYYYVRGAEGRGAARFVLPFVVVVFVAGGVNPYIAGFCVLIACAAVARLVLERRATWAHAAMYVLVLLATLVGSSAVFGVLVPGTGMAYAISGFDFYSMNLLSPINPAPFSSIALPSLPFATGGQYEGYNYLGLGIIGLLVLNGVARPRGVARALRPTPRSIPLVALSALCLVVAVSPRVTLGPWTIAHVGLPGIANGLVSLIHCAGRFFWPVHYLIVLFAVVLTYRNWPSPARELLLVGALVVQAADVGPVRARVQAVYERHPRDPLVSPAWRDLRATHARLIVLPAWQCGPGSPGGREGFRKFGLLAVAEGLQTNSYYAARYGPDQLRTHCSDVSALDGRDLDPRAAYVVDDKTLALWEIAGMRSHVCAVVDGFNLCTRNDRGLSSSPAVRAKVEARIPAYALGEALTFGSGGNGAPFVWRGWAPDPSGIWTDGSEATLLMRIGGESPAPLQLTAQARALVDDRHPRLDVFVLANGNGVGRWTFTSWSGAAGTSETRRVEIPASVVARSPALRLQFVVADPRSPRSLGLWPEARAFGIHLERLQIARAR